MRTDKLTGLAIVSLAEGAQLGRVEESLFDPATLRLASLRAKGDGGEFLVPREHIASVGADAVTVESSAVTQAAVGQGAALLGWGDLQKRKVVDGAGTLLGTVSNLEFDAATGDVISLSAHKGGVFGLGGETTAIDAARIRNVGPELITVAD